MTGSGAGPVPAICFRTDRVIHVKVFGRIGIRSNPSLFCRVASRRISAEKIRHPFCRDASKGDRKMTADVGEYKKALAKELLPAMGCTEPIALAYAAAEAGRRLGGYPESIDV